jgi:antitoxin YefM
VSDKDTDRARLAAETSALANDPVDRAKMAQVMADLHGNEATEFLLRSPANAARLRQAIERLEAGGGEVHDLIDPDGR